MQLTFSISEQNIRDTEEALAWEAKGHSALSGNICFATVEIKSTLNQEEITLVDIPALTLLMELLHFIKSNRHRMHAKSVISGQDQEYGFNLYKNDKCLTLTTRGRKSKRIYTECPSWQNLRDIMESFLNDYYGKVPNVILSHPVKLLMKAYDLKIEH